MCRRAGRGRRPRRARVRAPRGRFRRSHRTGWESRMTHREVELLAIGAGPSNLALAVALEELGPDDLADNCVVVERHPTVQWQPGLLVPWAKSQVSFLKDLVTLRNPTSRF